MDILLYLITSHSFPATLNYHLTFIVKEKKSIRRYLNKSFDTFSIFSKARYFTRTNDKDNIK